MLNRLVPATGGFGYDEPGHVAVAPLPVQGLGADEMVPPVTVNVSVEDPAGSVPSDERTAAKVIFAPGADEAGAVTDASTSVPVTVALAGWAANAVNPAVAVMTDTSAVKLFCRAPPPWNSRFA
jgi:hypothetical protein